MFWFFLVTRELSVWWFEWSRCSETCRNCIRYVFIVFCFSLSCFSVSYGSKTEILTSRFRVLVTDIWYTFFQLLFWARFWVLVTDICLHFLAPILGKIELSLAVWVVKMLWNLSKLYQICLVCFALVWAVFLWVMALKLRF